MLLAPASVRPAKATRLDERRQHEQRSSRRPGVEENDIGCAPPLRGRSRIGRAMNGGRAARVRLPRARNRRGQPLRGCGLPFEAAPTRSVGCIGRVHRLGHRPASRAQPLEQGSRLDTELIVAPSFGEQDAPSPCGRKTDRYPASVTSSMRPSAVYASSAASTWPNAARLRASRSRAPARRARSARRSVAGSTDGGGAIPVAELDRFRFTEGLRRHFAHGGERRAGMRGARRRHRDPIVGKRYRHRAVGPIGLAGGEGLLRCRDGPVDGGDHLVRRELQTFPPLLPLDRAILL